MKLQADAPLNDKAAQQAFNIELGVRGVALQRLQFIFLRMSRIMMFRPPLDNFLLTPGDRM